MLPNQKKKLGIAGVGLYLFVVAVVVVRAVMQAKNRGMLRTASILIICCSPYFALAAAPSHLSTARHLTTFSHVTTTSPPLGADFAAVSKAQASKLGITGGVVVVKIHAGGTLSNQTKMKEGFIITKIGDIAVTSVAGLRQAVGHQKATYQIQGVYPGSKEVVYYEIHDF